MARKHSHYYKDVSSLQEIDVYSVLALFGVSDHAIGHAIKKLLCAGKRGSKDLLKDYGEAIDSINRACEMLGGEPGSAVAHTSLRTDPDGKVEGFGVTPSALVADAFKVLDVHTETDSEKLLQGLILEREERMASDKVISTQLHALAANLTAMQENLRQGRSPKVEAKPKGRKRATSRR